MKDNANRLPLTIKILILMQVFLGLNGLLGGGLFLLAPDGHLLQMPFSHLKNTPFSDFLIPGLLLFMFLGVYPIAVACSLWRKPTWHWPDFLNPSKQTHWSWAGSLAAGLIAMIWIIVQIQWIPIGFLHILIFSWGILILFVTMLLMVWRYYRRNP